MDINILIWTALSIGFIHTIVGPDHYLPFVVMNKARNWSFAKTMWITFFSGVGHVVGSIALGILGIALGTALNLLESVESYRGNIAAWLLIGFGIAYGMWGIRYIYKAREHQHKHEHQDSEDHLQEHDHNEHTHQHTHKHFGRHAHIHGDEKSVTPWALFIIFVLGPCEPLIPILMYPAAQGSWADVALVSVAFGGATILTMMGVVAFAIKGLANIQLGFMEKYVHAIAGFIIAISGLSIQFLGL